MGKGEPLGLYFLKLTVQGDLVGECVSSSLPPTVPMRSPLLREEVIHVQAQCPLVILSDRTHCAEGRDTRSLA